jgi:hypothetical protein
MLLLKNKFTYRCESEDEAKGVVEAYKQKGKEEGFFVNKFSYQLKEKKSKGEVIDNCYLTEIEVIYATIWGALE